MKFNSKDDTLVVKKSKHFFKVIGPGIIIASAVLGPGSITVASRIGSEFGYELLWVLIFSPLAMVMLFKSKNIYQLLEKVMMVMVMIMISAFVINLVFAKPVVTDVLSGFIPTSFSESYIYEMVAMVGTTFSLIGCLYQAYLIQDKGWKLNNLKTGLHDTLIGITVLSVITFLVIVTSAAALHPAGIKVSSAADMALQLEALFGHFAKYIFSLGLIAAAFSSLVVNAFIGGSLLSDALGYGRSLNATVPRALITTVLFIGMIVAVFFKGNIVYALVIAQAATIFAVPAVGIGMFLLANNNKIMGNLKNNLRQNIFSVIGLILVGVMVYFISLKLFAMIGNL